MSVSSEMETNFVATEELLSQKSCLLLLGTRTVSFHVGLVFLLAWLLFASVMFRVLQRSGSGFKLARRRGGW